MAQSDDPNEAETSAVVGSGWLSIVARRKKGSKGVQQVRDLNGGHEKTWGGSLRHVKWSVGLPLGRGRYTTCPILDPPKLSRRHVQRSFFASPALSAAVMAGRSLSPNGSRARMIPSMSIRYQVGRPWIL